MTGSKDSWDRFIGSTIDDQFLVEKKLGAGGMGVVFLAEQVGMDRKVVVKLMRPELMGDETATTRFQREAKAVARLNHPNIVQIFLMGETEGYHYLAMEYVEGRPLSHLMRSIGRIPEERALVLASQILDALAEAHRAGILHRDLKPDNIMVRTHRAGTDLVKVLDFGLAKLVGDAAGPGVTQTGIIAGTPRYMSPEQARGKTLDFKSDLYSFGVILHEMLTGEHPFDADSTYDYLVKHNSEPVAPPRQRFTDLRLSGSTERVVMCCLAKKPEDRPAGADETKRGLSPDSEGLATPPVDLEAPTETAAALLLEATADTETAEKLPTDGTVAGDQTRWILRGISLVAFLALVGLASYGAWRLIFPPAVDREAPVVGVDAHGEAPTKVVPSTAGAPDLSTSFPDTREMAGNGNQPDAGTTAPDVATSGVPATDVDGRDESGGVISLSADGGLIFLQEHDEAEQSGVPWGFDGIPVPPGSLLNFRDPVELNYSTRASTAEVIQLYARWADERGYRYMIIGPTLTMSDARSYIVTLSASYEPGSGHPTDVSVTVNPVFAPPLRRTAGYFDEVLIPNLVLKNVLDDSTEYVASRPLAEVMAAYRDIYGNREGYRVSEIQREGKVALEVKSVRDDVRFGLIRVALGLDWDDQPAVTVRVEKKPARNPDGSLVYEVWQPGTN